MPEDDDNELTCLKNFDVEHGGSSAPNETLTVVSGGNDITNRVSELNKDATECGDENNELITGPAMNADEDHVNEQSIDVKVNTESKFFQYSE